MSYELASLSGLIAGTCFFLSLSAAIGFLIYALMAWPSARRAELRLGAVRKTIAIPVGFAIGIAIFSAVYVSSLAGFHTVTVGDDDVRIDYAVPPSTTVLPYTDIADVTRRPAYRLQWRLEISTRSGRKFESAAGSQRAITEAAESIALRRGSRADRP